MRPLNLVSTALVVGIQLQKYIGLKMDKRWTFLAQAGTPWCGLSNVLTLTAPR